MSCCISRKDGQEAAAAAQPVFAGFMSGPQTIAGSFVFITLGQQLAPDAAFYTHAVGTAAVTVVQGGRYQIGFSATATKTGGGGAATLFWAVIRTTGASTIVVPGLCQNTTHHGPVIAGSASASQCTDLLAGDIVQLAAVRLSATGGNSITNPPCGCLTIVRL